MARLFALPEWVSASYYPKKLGERTPVIEGFEEVRIQLLKLGHDYEYRLRLRVQSYLGGHRRKRDANLRLTINVDFVVLTPKIGGFKCIRKVPSITLCHAKAKRNRPGMSPE